MTTTASAGRLLVMLSMAGAAAGCDTRDECERYVDDRFAKAVACGASPPLTDADTWMREEYIFICRAGPPEQATCLDACVALLDCACTFKSPQDGGCAAKQKPYMECSAPCMAIK